MKESIIKKESERIYIVKYIDIIGIEEMRKSFGSMSKSNLLRILEDIKKQGKYEYYKNMTDDEWEKIENKEKHTWR